MKQFRSKYLDMRNLLVIATVATSLSMTACGDGSDAGSAILSPTARAAMLGENLMVRVMTDTNDAAKSGTNCAELGADWASCARGKLILENAGGRSLVAGGWTLYVHSIRRILMIEHPAFAWKHITGDLYALTPRADAFTLGAGERVEVPFVGEYWYQRYSDLLPRAYVVADGSATPAILAHNDTDDETRYVDHIPPVKDDAAAFAATPAQAQRARAEAALPTAQQVAARALPAVLRETAGEGAVQVGGIDLSLAGLSASQVAAFVSRAAALGLSGPSVRVSGRIAAGAMPADIAKSGGYRLTIATDGVSIDAFNAAGLFYGVPAMTLEDAPRYIHVAA